MPHELPHIEAFIYSLLTTDPVIAGVVGERVFKGFAPEGTPYPLVVFDLNSGGDVNGVGRLRLVTVQTYLIKLIVQGDLTSGHRAVVDRMDDLLQDVTNAEADGYVFNALRERPFWMKASERGVEFSHYGGFYVFEASPVGDVIEPPEALPFDDLDVVAAFSIGRRLRNDYTGDVFRVRRSTDNAESNIGFAENLLDEDALLNFVGNADGFLATVFDQSGNGLDLSQGTASLQPKIVSGGQIHRMHGQPAARFASPQWLTYSGSFPLVVNVHAMTVGEFEASSIPARFSRMIAFLSPLGGADFNNQYSWMLSRKASDGIFYAYLNGLEANAGTAPGSGPHLAHVKVSTGGITVGVDGASGAPVSTSGVMNQWNKMLWGGNESMVPGDGVNGYLGEMAVFPDFLSSDLFNTYRASVQTFWGTP